MTIHTTSPSAIDDQLAELLIYYATFAPSSHNTQPWRFEWDSHQIRVYADFSRWLPVADADWREMYISVGCALENLQLAAQVFRYRSSITYFPDSKNHEWVASMSLTKDPRLHDEESIELFSHIMRRRTYHHTYRARAIEEDVRERLRHWAGEVSLCLIDDSEDKRKIEQWVGQADTIQFSDPAYREELGHWIGQSAFGTPWLISKMGQWVVTHFDMGTQRSRQDATLIRQAPLLGILYTQHNTATDRVMVGQAYERMSLGGATLGLGAQPLSQPLEVPTIKPHLASLLPDPDGHPQHLFRLGYVNQEQKPTPRRPVKEFLPDR